MIWLEGEKKKDKIAIQGGYTGRKSIPALAVLCQCSLPSHTA